MVHPLPAMKRFFLLLVFLCFYLESVGQDKNEITDRLDRYLQSANNAYRFNGVALVYHKGNVLLNKGYGYSNMTRKSPNTVDTRFPILSITKSFTATIILKLQEEGKLSVNDNLAKYIPDYPNGPKIKIHHLLTHSSGIHNYTEDVDVEDSLIVNYPLSKEKVVNHFKDKPVDFPPGKQYGYNNSGYFLLGLVIEKITGKPYETIVRETIFTPLGMTQSGFDFINLPKEIRAQGYQSWDENTAEPYKHYDSTFAYSAGSIYSTSNDLLKWAQAVSSKQILKTETWELAFKPRVNNYGYGWRSGVFFDNKYVRHSGGYPGFMSEFIYYRDHDLAIVLLNNFGNYEQNVWSIGMGLTCIALNLPYDEWKLRKEVVVDKNILKKHVGVYAESKKQQINVTLEGDNLFVLIERSLKLMLHPENENTFFLKDYNDVLTFESDKVTIHAHGKDFIYKKK
jgi:CubicO group peptidase (beta-lactamase class C family)